MRFSLAALVLPAIAAAQEAEKPLNAKAAAWLANVKSYVASQYPLDAGASEIARNQLTELTRTNWETVLAPSYRPKTNTHGPDTWMVLMTGGNRTCGGHCEQLEVEFNKTVSMFSADRQAPRFGIIDCDKSLILCNTWLASPPTLWYIQRPELVPGGAEQKETPIHVVHLNTTTTKIRDIVAIHLDNGYKAVPKMDSMFHPFDGKLAQLGLNKPIGFVLFLFSMVPSWAMMLGVSFLTRYMMNNRIGNQQVAERERARANQPLGGAPPANSQ